MAKIKKVTLKNVSGNSVSVMIDGKLKKFSFSDVERKITMDELEDLYNDRGGRVILEEDILRVMEAEARESIGLPKLDEYCLDGEGFKLLFEGTDEKFEEFLQYCSESMMDRAISYIIENKIDNMRKRQLIEEYSGKNLKPILDELIKKEAKGTKKTKQTKDENKNPKREKVEK